MPKIKTIKEYHRNYKSFPIGTIIDVTWELANTLIEEGIAKLLNSKKTKKIKPIKIETKKVEKNGSIK